jgi:hypothetical protein
MKAVLKDGRMSSDTDILGNTAYAVSLYIAPGSQQYAEGFTLDP